MVKKDLLKKDDTKRSKRRQPQMDMYKYIRRRGNRRNTRQKVSRKKRVQKKRNRNKIRKKWKIRNQKIYHQV